MGEEGEFKKRFVAMQKEMDEMDFERITPEEIMAVVEDARKDFPKITESTDGEYGEYNFDYYDREEIDAWRKKWFGSAEKEG